MSLNTTEPPNWADFIAFLEKRCQVLENTIFGYIISSKIDSITKQEDSAYCGLIQELDDLNQSIKNFWEIERIDEDKPVKSPEELLCENHFLSTHSRDENGRYVVQMPMKSEGHLRLGNSKDTALKRLNSLWSKLLKEPKLLSLYQEFLKEYEALGHMEEVHKDVNLEPSYYIPHHGIYHPDKSSTKLRVVFDASAKTSSGTSLNEQLLNGGIVQEDLFSIMIRFRKHTFAFIADIKKLYRQIVIDPDQRKFQ
ncbi:uncharacterized protein LOC118200186 [Stegodyphus dumicola]|uniref:uncharacterized protein LOC118200186 n=1 Tax=Stegodyphus dumicola TaxID=202533 RepID=UPI0015AF9C3F|nr:uncharacterized protein LOC118200186 [Stegodyphus dumicola]